MRRHASSERRGLGLDSLTGSYLVGPGFSVTLPRRDSDPIELGHAADWLSGPLPAQAAFVALDLRSEQSIHRLTGWGGVDQFLAAIGRRINEVCPSDIVFRTGVDTFLIAIATLPSSKASAFAEEFREAIAAPLPLGDTSSALASRVTVAVACCGAETTAVELFKRVHDVLREANAREMPFMIAPVDIGS
jgi:GGDEF domain-containing protein